MCSRLRGTAGIRVAAAGTSVPFARRGLLCSTRSSPSRRPPTDVWRGFDQPDHESACGRASESAGLAADSRAHLPAGFEAPAGVLIACLEGIQVEQPSTGKGKSGCRCRARPAGASGLHSLTRSGPLFSHGQASRVGKKLMPLPCCLVAASQSSEANSEQSQTAVAHAAAGARTHSHDRASGSLAPETQASKSQSESSVRLPALLD